MHTQNGKCVILPLNSTAEKLVQFECVSCQRVLKGGERTANVFHHVETRTHYEVAS